MQDQHFMQQWNAGHDRFSEDFDHLARKLLKATGSVLRGGQPDEPEQHPASQETTLACRARLTGIGMIAGIVAGSSLAMITPVVSTPDCPPKADQACLRGTLA